MSQQSSFQKLSPNCFLIEADRKVRRYLRAYNPKGTPSIPYTDPEVPLVKKVEVQSYCYDGDPLAPTCDSAALVKSLFWNAFMQCILQSCADKQCVQTGLSESPQSSVDSESRPSSPMSLQLRSSSRRATALVINWTMAGIDSHVALVAYKLSVSSVMLDASAAAMAFTPSSPSAFPLRINTCNNHGAGHVTSYRSRHRPHH